MILYLTYKQLGKNEIIEDTPELHKSKYYKNEIGRKKIYFYENKLWQTYYYVKNQLHNEHGPAYIQYHEDGKILMQQYFIHHKIHKENGPAHIHYARNGKVIEKQYWNNGKKYKTEYYNTDEMSQNDLAVVYYYNKDGTIKEKIISSME
jgi:hypothetical protein